MQEVKIIPNKNDIFYSLSPDVFLVSRSGTSHLINFKHGKFYALDEDASFMLSLFLDLGWERAVASITETYDVSEEQIKTDLSEILEKIEYKKIVVNADKQDFFALRLLSNFKTFIHHFFTTIILSFLKIISLIFVKLLSYCQTSSEQNILIPNRYTVNLLLTLSWLSFRILGWSRTISLWKQWHSSIKEKESFARDKGEVIQIIDRVVRQAASWKLFFPVVCKERALVGYHILRTFYGLPATLIIGIERNPFQVHAWVECENIIITDDAAHCQIFTPLIKYF